MMLIGVRMLAFNLRSVIYLRHSDVQLKIEGAVLETVEQNLVNLSPVRSGA